MEKTKKFNYFQFKHIDEDTTVRINLNAMFVGDVIDSFVLFLKGCGHFEKAIYEHMSEISDAYFEYEEKRNKLKDHPDIDLD